MKTSASLPCCLGLLLASGFSASASDRPLHFPFHGEKPFGTPLERRCLRDDAGLTLRDGGVLFGKGLVAPEVVIDGWRGEQGTVAFWLKSVDWLASTKEHVVFLKAIEPKEGSFLIYKYYTGDKIWFYGTQPKASKRRRVRIHFAYDSISPIPPHPHGLPFFIGPPGWLLRIVTSTHRTVLPPTSSVCRGLGWRRRAGIFSSVFLNIVPSESSTSMSLGHCSRT